MSLYLLFVLSRSSKTVKLCYSTILPEKNTLAIITIPEEDVDAAEAEAGIVAEADMMAASRRLLLKDSELQSRFPISSVPLPKKKALS